MAEIKNIRFVESEYGKFNELMENVHEWYKFNERKIKIINASSGVVPVEKEKIAEETSYFRRCINIQYEGENVVDPKDCTHENTSETIVLVPTCKSTGLKKISCTKCGVVLDKVTLDKIPHSWVSNGNGTHTCTVPNGCGVTETCSPNDYGDVCTKCGYKTPEDRVLAINTDSVEGMVLDSPFELALHSTVDDEVSWEFVSGSLPDGIYWSNEGVISGTPTSLGEYTFTVKAKYHKQTVSKTYTTEVKDSLELQITTDYINGMVVETPFSQQLTSNASSTEWSVTSGELPSGLILSTGGLLTGTPTTHGIYNFTVQAKYHLQSVTKSYSVNVARAMYTVTFDPQGGSVSETSRKVAQGSTLGSLPTPTLEGSEFGGWFTAAVGGLKIDSSYSISSNTTLYARWGQGSDINFGSATTEFNIQVGGKRTNYNDNPYALYGRISGDDTNAPNLIFQTGISSDDGTNNMSASNRKVTLYLKVTNNGEANNFDLGFDCDSYVYDHGDDKVKIERIANGVKLGNGLFTVTVPYENTAWIGQYSERTSHRYNAGSPVGTITDSSVDTGYAFTMPNIFINSGSYVILEVTFQML